MIGNLDVLQSVIIAAAYLLTLLTSGLVVRHFVGGPIEKERQEGSQTPARQRRYDTGAVIGKCENFLTITLILAGAFTGLALIFTAKSIVRSEHIKKDPGYYLGGTLVNFTYSVLMAFAARVVLSALGHPL